MVAHVGIDGRPSTVVVVGSSGNASLDAAARDAMRRWRFTPARNGSGAVPYDYVLDFDFRR